MIAHSLWMLEQDSSHVAAYQFMERILTIPLVLVDYALGNETAA